MASDLTTLIAGVNALIPSTIGGATIAKLVGESSLTAERTPPCVVWVPRREAYQRSQRPSRSSTSSTYPVAIYERTISLDLFLWAAKLTAGAPDSGGTDLEHMEAVDDLINVVAPAIQGYAWSYPIKIVGGEWVSAAGAVDRLGYGYTLSLETTIAVPTAALTTATATTIVQTTTVQTP